MMRAGVVGIIVAGSIAAWAQAPAPAVAPVSTGTPAPSPTSAPVAAPQVAAPAASPAVAGGKLHGTVKSGNIPLPGVTLTAQNSLTGKRYSTTTDITGAWQMNIPQNGRYVIRTQFAAFAQGSQEAVLNASSHDQLVNFELILASRQAEQDQQQQAQQGTREGSAHRRARPGRAANGRQRSGKHEPRERVERRYRHRSRHRRPKRRGAAFDRRQLRLQRRIGRDYRPGRAGERLCRHES